MLREMARGMAALDRLRHVGAIEAGEPLHCELDLSAKGEEDTDESQSRRRDRRKGALTSISVVTWWPRHFSIIHPEARVARLRWLLGLVLSADISG